jgi:hypothetical protein
MFCRCERRKPNESQQKRGFKIGKPEKRYNAQKTSPDDKAWKKGLLSFPSLN